MQPQPNQIHITMEEQQQQDTDFRQESNFFTETIDLLKDGTYAVRAKGALVVRGVAQERIIPCSIIVTDEGVRISSLFDIQLADHEVRIPLIVQQKIASTVQVKLDLLFKTENEK